MRILSLALLLTSATFRLSAQDEPGTATLNAMVTVRISDLDDALWPKVNARVAKELNMNIEYSCITTGILVLRLQQVTATEKADVMAIVKRVLHEAGVKGKIDFLDVQVQPGQGQRCHVPTWHARSGTGLARG